MDGLLIRIVAVLGRFNALCARAGRVLAGALLATMLVLTLAQILSRALFGHSLGWTEEVTRAALVWSVFLIAPFAYRTGEHIAVVSFAEALSPRWLLAVSAAINVLVVWICVMFFRESFAFWRRGLDMTAATLDLKMAWIYAIVPLAFALLILVGVELLLRLVLHARGAKSGLQMVGAMPAVARD
jgi:TRAP-type C4-dicarboxylate transport system permease small subunit